MNYVSLFLEFLAKNRCLERYFYNFEKQSKSEFDPEFFNEINSLFSGNPQIYITGAFIFVETKEGKDYWAELNSNWCAYLKINASNER